jgi:asparagine synthase (glutamine-hydrolysing)
MYEPSSFFCFVVPKEHDETVMASRNTFRRLRGRAPSATLETSTRVVHLWVSEGTRLGKDGSGRISALLHGEIYEPLADQASHLAACFADKGDAFASDLNGTYAVLLVDQAADRIVVITDRLASRRVLHGTCAGGTFLTTRLDWVPTEATSLDLTSLAWYLTNTGIYNARSIFEGVRPLERASVHEITPRGSKSKRYWDDAHRPTRQSAHELERAFSEHLVSAVARSLYDKPDVFVSLSGGYDATGLVGILSNSLGVRGVHCLTYANGEVRPGSDAWVAQSVAQQVGYTHETVEGFRGDLCRNILDNAKYGHIQRESVDETDALATMAERFAQTERPVLLTGDNTFEMVPYRMGNANDVLRAYVRTIEVLEPLRHHLPDGLYDELALRLTADQQALLGHYQRAGGSLYEQAHALYVDQRLTHHHMPWRESYAGRFVTVRNPYLDKDLMTFVTTLPMDFIRGKRFFRRTIGRMYPTLFSTPRAVHSDSRTDLDAAFTLQAERVRELVTGCASKFDEVVPPGAVLQLLDEVVRHGNNGNDQKRSLPSGPLGWAHAGMRKALRLSGLSEYAVYHSRMAPPRPLAPSRLLMKLLVARTSLVKP